MSLKKKVILSGMQPTGYLHIGHYFGVLNNFVEYQEEYDCYYMIADLHALTSLGRNYEKVAHYITSMVSDWLAAGIDPQKSTLFIQSALPEHSELHLILSMYTPTSWLLRNPTYKDKQENISKNMDTYGFLGYPVLQAADILLYQAERIPIGEDQLPHLELTREIARSFNHHYQNTFKIPQAKLSAYPKILGTDGRKMSKTYQNTLDLNESEESFDHKMMKMQTDPARIRRSDPGTPEKCTVFSYYDLFAKNEKKEIAESCRTAKIGCVDCKKNILKSMNPKFRIFREKKMELEKGSFSIVKSILDAGNQKAKAIAKKTLDNVKESIGMSYS